MQFQKKGLKNERKRAPVNQDMSSSFMPVGGSRSLQLGWSVAPVGRWDSTFHSSLMLYAKLPAMLGSRALAAAMLLPRR